MDNTFENGFMCGLLLSIDESNNGSLIKDDKIFQYIVNNGIPFASAKVTSEYKTIYVVVDCTGIQQLSGLKSVRSGEKYINDYLTLTENENGVNVIARRDGHPEIYSAISTVISIGCIFYKGDIPLWASIGYTDSYMPTVKTADIMYETGRDFNDKDYTEADFKNNTKIPYAKECVAWKSIDYEFDKESVEYSGDYTLLIDEVTENYKNLFGSVYLLNTNEEKVNYITCKYNLIKKKYKEKYYTYIHNGGTQNDTARRPEINLDSTEITNVNRSVYSYAQFLSTTSYSNYSINRIFSDKNNDELISIDHDVIKKIHEENWPKNKQYVKPMAWLN